MLHRLRGLGLTARGVRGRRRRRRHLVLEPLPGRALRRREHGLLLLVLRTSCSRSGSGRSGTPTQPEILRYANHVADRFDLRRDIQFDTRVTAAALRRGDQPLDGRAPTAATRSPARFCIMATGCLSAAKLPDVPGPRHASQGERYHTGQWPHEGVDFTGKRVGVIGTGSSGIQSIPIIAEQAADLTVFQRTPNFSMPARNRPLTADETPRSRPTTGLARRRARSPASACRSPIDRPSPRCEVVRRGARRASSRRRWEQRRPACLLGLVHRPARSNQQANDTAAEFVRAKIRDDRHDPRTPRRCARELPGRHQAARASTPTTTRRSTAPTSRWSTSARRRSSEITPTRHPDAPTAEYEVDAIVFATGFDAMTGALLAIDIRGRDGLSLRRRVGGGPAHLPRAAVGRASRTCSRSPARAARRCSPT